jgi:hypothetical protein
MKGKIIYDKKAKEFFLIEECNENNYHDTATFENLFEKYKENKDIFDMNLKKLQKYLIRSVFNSNTVTDINTAKR